MKIYNHYNPFNSVSLFIFKRDINKIKKKNYLKHKLVEPNVSPKAKHLRGWIINEPFCNGVDQAWPREDYPGKQVTRMRCELLMARRSHPGKVISSTCEPPNRT